MSRIFDALQRSEAERFGQDPSDFCEAMELIEAAEKKTHPPAANGKRRIAAADETAPEVAPAYSPSTPDLDRYPVLEVAIQPENHLVAVAKQESLGAEKFRFLGVKLRQLRQTRPLKKVLITSTIPQEGKSTVAANLACTLARRRPHKVLLIDGDLRRPTMALQFGLGKLPGLCEWLSGQVEDINLYRLESLGMWILPAGEAPENPLELMQSGKLPALLDRLSGWFDWIVIDSPPVLPLADTSIWSRLADGILLVTRKGTTEKQQLRHGVDALEKSKLLGALVNGSLTATHSDYYQRYTSPPDRK